MINIQRQWKQANNSDLYGNISVTKNINFDKEGYLSLSNSSRAAMHSSIDADFDVPAVILYSENYEYFVETWDAPFKTDYQILSSYPTQITDSGVPDGDLQSDAVLSNSTMVVTQDTDVDFYDIVGNSWTDTNISLTDSGQHAVENFLSLNAIAIADINTVKLYSSPLTATPVLITTLTIPSDFEITKTVYYNQNLYIGTRHKYGGHAFMFVWNGQGSAYQQAYETDSNIIFSLCVHQGGVVALTGQGELLRFNGGGFTQLDAFPIYYTDMSLTDNSNIGLYKNIMKSNGDVLYILFNNRENDAKKLTNQPDGVWCYDDKVGLYHRYSLSNSLVNIQTIATTSVDTTTDAIVVASPALPTGTEVYYKKGTTAIGGLTDETKYFVIKVDATHIKLATTKALAIAGTAIDLTSTGANNQSFVFFPNIDYGQFLGVRTMALATIDRSVTNPQYGTDVIWGAEVEQRQLTGDDGMMGTTSGLVEARGYFITPKVFSENVIDTFNLLTLKYSKLMTELDKIIVKYRTEDDGLEFIDVTGTNWRGTWTSTNTFTATQTDWSRAVVGDEIEVLNGAAGGLLAHITQIVDNSGTYTVTIDETFDNYITGDLSTIIFRNWKKFAVIDQTNTNGYITENINVLGKFIQLKIELRGLGIKIEELKVDNKYLLPAKN
jgi:hypothetical protein